MILRPPRVHVVSPSLAAELARATDETLAPGTRAELVHRLRPRVSDGVLRPGKPSYVVYRLTSGQHRQTGVVVELSVDDYRQGRVRRHEATQPERERQLSAFLEATNVELVPVTLIHKARPTLRTLLAEAAANEPDVNIVSEDALVQTAWVVRDTHHARAVQDELTRINTLYIADGHHRIAAAERFATRRGHVGGDRSSDFVLGALFPWDEMRILGYHRCVTRPAGLTASELIAALARQPVVARIEECVPAEAAQPASGVVSVHVDGRWYQAQLRTPRDPADTRASLDLVAVEESLVAAVLGVTDVSSDSMVTPVPGTADPATVARRCAERNEIGFLLHPPSTDQIIAVSDAGLVMPPKSTWFDPKARVGPFFRDLA